jgi:hypothetical protein
MEREETEAEEKNYLFCWDDVPESERERERLRKVLRDKFDIDWAENAEICKSRDDKTLCVFKDGDSSEIMLDEEKEKATLTTSDGKTYDLKVNRKNGKSYIVYEKKKVAYVLVKVKPKYSEEFCITMVACKELCNRASKSKNLAQIDEVYSVLGPFDFLMTLSGENEDKINKTIFKIRETLGSYANDTLTLTKFKIPMTKEELEKKFEKIFGEKYLYHKNGGKIPDEGLEPDAEIDLKVISNAEPTSLKKLLEEAKKFLETEDLKKRIEDLEKQIEELKEKRS